MDVGSMEKFHRQKLRRRPESASAILAPATSFPGHRLPTAKHKDARVLQPKRPLQLQNMTSACSQVLAYETASSAGADPFGSAGMAWAGGRPCARSPRVRRA